MDHDTKPTNYKPLGFEPTPMKPEAGCLSTMVLRRCGYSLSPLPIRPNNKWDVRRMPTILGVPLPCHWTMLGSAVSSH